jgi:hypothetical protein
LYCSLFESVGGVAPAIPVQTTKAPSPATAANQRAARKSPALRIENVLRFNFMVHLLIKQSNFVQGSEGG